MAEDKKTPPLPEIPSPSQEKLNRLLAANWLENLAVLIRDGQVIEFQLDWAPDLAKPAGPVTVQSKLLKSSLELKVAYEISLEQAKAQEAAKPESYYSDFSEDLKDHKCDDKRCVVCTKPNPC